MSKVIVFFAGLLGRIVLLLVLITGAFSGGEVWAICYDKGKLIIGDFWAAAFIIILIYTLYIDIEALLNTWWDEVKKHEGDCNDENG